MKYQARDTGKTVEAIQLQDGRAGIGAVVAFIGNNLSTTDIEVSLPTSRETKVTLKLPGGGTARLKAGDYLIREADGFLCPVEAETFARRYVRAD